MDLYSIYPLIPFGLMLLLIATLPVFYGDYWHKNINKLIISCILGSVAALWLLINGFSVRLAHTLIFDYVPFIILLGTLYIITGGIFVDGDIEAKPAINTLILFIGAALASLMGTTGAAMVLIRVFMHTNKTRKFKVHSILFFIAIVANCGGLLTPLGDPPLFLLYLRGVPFLWFLKLFPEWLFVNGLLLLIYFIIDSFYWKKETFSVRLRELENVQPIKIKGMLNIIFLLLVIFTIALVNGNTLNFISQNHYFGFLREFILVILSALSLIFTTNKLRKSNNFTWEPIEEVAYLFFGIFITMLPCIIFLEDKAASLGINTPVLFYYVTGGLSSVLDNAPTAVTFYSLASGLVKSNSVLFLDNIFVGGIPETLLRAISIGAVCFGSMTYIGNGPNFMIKSIAENHGIKMPSFLGYIIGFSLIILLPVFIIAQLLFI